MIGCANHWSLFAAGLLLAFDAVRWMQREEAQARVAGIPIGQRGFPTS
jgi:hypothetical protein